MIIGQVCKRGIATIFVAWCGLAAFPAVAEMPDLYTATVIVTGRDNLVERHRGIVEALPKVLTQLTVDPAVAARASGYLDRADSLVDGFDYVDRKEGIQISDEQGTRERSFELAVHFSLDGINKVLAELGVVPWTGPRPDIGVALVINDGNGPYLLTRTSEKGYGQRLALVDDAETLAIGVKLPDSEAGIGPDAVAAVAKLNTPVHLIGHMTATPDGYWDTDWRLTGDGIGTAFTYAHATFDVAIGGALLQSARALAGANR